MQSHFFVSKSSARAKLATLKKLATKFDEASHPRYPAGHPLGGQFMSSSNEQIPLQMPRDRYILGRQTTTLLELSAIAANDSGKLTDNELTRLIAVRNNFDSFEDFLAHPFTEDGDNEHFLYAGSRVEMGVSFEGDVDFTIDRSHFRYDRTLSKPSEELIGMQSIFKEYLKSPASRRLLTNTPAYDTLKRFEMRIKHYKNNGFIAISDQKHLPERLRRKNDDMILDNRINPKTFIAIPSNPRVAVRGKEIIDNVDDFDL